jgi:hypothetical protein
MNNPMDRELDHQAEAVMAMKKAIAASCPAERLGWLQVALAWKGLARLVEGRAAS